MKWGENNVFVFSQVWAQLGLLAITNIGGEESAPFLMDEPSERDPFFLFFALTQKTRRKEQLRSFRPLLLSSQITDIFSLHVVVYYTTKNLSLSYFCAV